MMSSTLLLNIPVSPSPAPWCNPKPGGVRCRASSERGAGFKTSRPALPAWAAETDFYELLGVARSSGQAEIKAAYRALQKRCHPDVAGVAGHDMAIVLNEAYSLLSDPLARLVYDEERAKLSEFDGYTGRPLYSTWRGPESEQRAVFVDELRCVGCLKCALFASKTFAIESAFGRARVVAQWADDEDKIAEAIQTCPVDCISMVERSNLPALEFLMSKQPRGTVRMSVGNTVGARVSDVFNDAAKFESRFRELRERAGKRGPSKSDSAMAARHSAVQAIRSVSGGWWPYWRPFFYPAASSGATSLDSRPSHSGAGDRAPRFPRLLQEAAAARRSAQGTSARPQARREVGYWTPLADPPSLPATTKDPRDAGYRERKIDVAAAPPDSDGEGRIDLSAPAVMGLVAAAMARWAEETAGGGLREHVGGAAALHVVNSSELRAFLAGVTWFVIGAALAGIAETFRRR